MYLQVEDIVIPVGADRFDAIACIFINIQLCDLYPLDITQIQSAGAIAGTAPGTIDELCIGEPGIFYIPKPDAGKIGILNFNLIDHHLIPVANINTAVQLF